MMLLMKSAVRFNGKLLPRLFREPEFAIQSACHQAIVELPDRPHPIAGVRDDIEARRDIERSVKVNTEPRPMGPIYSRLSRTICPQGAPTLGVRPLTRPLQSSTSTNKTNFQIAFARVVQPARNSGRCRVSSTSAQCAS